MSSRFENDDDVIMVPVSGETVARLRALADECHADPADVASSLLHDILKEDEEAHFLLSAPAVGRPN